MKRLFCIFFILFFVSPIFSQEFSLSYKKFKKPEIIAEMEKRLEKVYNLKDKIEIVKEFIKKAPQNVLIHRTYQDLMKYYDQEKLFNEYKTLYEKNKNNPIYIYLFGRVQARGEDAKAYFEKSIEKDKNFYWGYIGLSYYYSNEMSPPDFARAEELLKKAISIDNSQPEAFINLHSLYTRQKKHEFADTVSNILMEINPDDDRIFFISLNRFKRTGELDRMVSALEKRIKEKGENPDLLMFLANVYFEMGNLDRTIANFERFVSLYPENPFTPATLYNLSLLYAKKLDKGKTLEYIEKAFEKGYNLGVWLENVPSFSFLRKEKGFRELILKINEKIGIGKKIKHFEGKSLDGEVIDIGKFTGKVVLIQFWATWCDYCKAEIPLLRDAYNKYNKKGFEIIAISLDDKRESLVSFVSKESLKWKHLFSGKGKVDPVAKMFGIDSIPSNLLVDKKGILRYADLRGEALLKKVEELLKEK